MLFTLRPFRRFPVQCAVRQRRRFNDVIEEALRDLLKKYQKKRKVK